MSRKLTTEEFIQKARLIHGNKYDYSKVVYINAITKIIIICPIHGEFLMSPDKHLNKRRGCPKCMATKIKESTSLTINELQHRSNIIHNNEYIIVGTYNGANKHISILHKICNNIFNQTPNHHIHSKNGCPHCKQSKGEKKY